MKCGHQALTDGCQNCDLVRSGLTPCGEFFLSPGSKAIPMYEFKTKAQARLVNERME